jgi:transposase
LEGLADWLTQCGITTVAMESTGVYWIPLYELLERRGFEVLLVEPRQIKKYRRKTDVLDSQWIQTLHTFGLLTGSFRPADAIVVLRSYMRQRSMLVKQGAQHVQHIQKALEQMNLKLTEVLSDVVGVSGLAILDAIVKGERDPHELSKLRHESCHHDEYTIALALQGNWREEHLFSLKQALELYRFYLKKMHEVDSQIESYLKSFEAQADETNLPKPTKRRSRRKNDPRFNVRELLYRMTGQDLTIIDGIGEHAALQIISEIGTDMNRWPTEKHFVSWLCLCPEPNKSGGRPQKKRKSKTQSSTNRVATTLRVCAQSLFSSKSTALGAFGRRIRARDGAPVAVTAMARKLAIIIYNMLRYGRPYIDQGAEYYNQHHREKVIQNLTRRAHQLGLTISPQPA